MPALETRAPATQAPERLDDRVEALARDLSAPQSEEVRPVVPGRLAGWIERGPPLQIPQPLGVR